MQVIHVGENPPGDVEHLAPGRGDVDDALAVAHKNCHPEFVLQRADLFGDPRLGGEQGLGRVGHIQPVALHLDDVAQLLEVHGCL